MKTQPYHTKPKCSCAQCMFSAESTEYNGFECRRNPPTFHPHGGGFLGCFPLISGRAWCGEFVGSDKGDDK